MGCGDEQLVVHGPALAPVVQQLMEVPTSHSQPAPPSLQQRLAVEFFILPYSFLHVLYCIAQAMCTWLT